MGHNRVFQVVVAIYSGFQASEVQAEAGGACDAHPTRVVIFS